MLQFAVKKNKKTQKRIFFLFEVREQWLDRQKKKSLLDIISNQLDFKSSQTN
jgi:hypothetical protein